MPIDAGSVAASFVRALSMLSAPSQPPALREALSELLVSDHLMMVLAAGGEEGESGGGGGDALGLLRRLEGGLECAAGLVRGAKDVVVAAKQEALRRAQEQERDERLCVVCLCAPKATLLLPCRHLCVCQSCSQHHALSKCPVCRAPIAETLDVYT